MHAVVFKVEIEEGREDAARAGLGPLIDFVKKAPGFVRGTWVGGSRRGLSLIVFETEDGARKVADNPSVPPDAPVTLRSVDVYEVLGEATA